MIVVRDGSFAGVYAQLCSMMKHADPVRTERWQGRDVSRDPSARTHELRCVAFEVPLRGREDLDHWRADCAPNLPWADDHFAERVGGEPLNPGEQWRNWPWAGSADTFREGEGFNHTYMERLWPKWARKTNGGEMPRKEGVRGTMADAPRCGIGWSYGDLWDLVELLAREPYTRQAWVPLFFPEDTGRGDGGRKPCTLGYQFLVRDDHPGGHPGGGPPTPELHVWYPLRSCDLVRHFRDDCYLAVRLLLWVLDRCRGVEPEFWGRARPGTYSMHMTSLHAFENDRRAL